MTPEERKEKRKKSLAITQQRAKEAYIAGQAMARAIHREELSRAIQLLQYEKEKPMPLTPDQVAQAQRQKEENYTLGLFNHIDEALINGESPIRFARLSEKGIKEIVKAYEEKGWNVLIEEGEDENQHHQLTLSPNPDHNISQVQQILDDSNKIFRNKKRYIGQHINDQND